MSIRADLSRMTFTAKEPIGTPTETGSRGPSRMGKNMARACLRGLMGGTKRDSGLIINFKYEGIENVNEFRS